jgi:poly(A) polymerase
MQTMKQAMHLNNETLLKEIGILGDKEGTQVYAVGGYVRDQILGNTIREIDFTVLGDGPDFAERAKKKLKGKGFVVYPKFGTASFLINGLKLEFVSAREEKYQRNSRNPVVSQSDLSSDLARRDFTINALAMGINENNFGEIIDPFHGQRDLKAKCIRTPLDPVLTFSDDPLRIMRAARFAGQLNFTIETRTLKAMTREKERLKIVSQERLTDEFLKILAHPKPSKGIKILNKSGVLALFCPELDALNGVEQRDEYHHKDVFEHSLKVLDNLARKSDNIYLRFSALMHDIGKPKVKRFIQGTGWTFHGHEQVGVQMLAGICRRLKLSNDFLRYSEKLTRLHMRPIHLIGEEVTDSAIRRLLFHAGDDIEDLMLLCRADITSGNPKRVKRHLANFDRVHEKMKMVEEKDRMRMFQSPVRGEEIMKICHIGPGPFVGKLKTKIEEAILDGIIPNEHDPALQYLLNIKDKVLGFDR